MKRKTILTITILLLAVMFYPGTGRTASPLPSWQEGPARTRIIAFVNTVCDRQSPDYVKPADRIAVFDNDGTMWTEKPLYAQLLFVFGHIHELAPQHPEWRGQQPFKAVLENDRKTLSRYGNRGIFQLLAASSGTDLDAYRASVQKWAARYRHPRFQQPLAGLVYQPMRELLSYLEENGFTVFIVSGGSVDFMRTLLPELYGIPSWRIIGTYVKTDFSNGNIVRRPQIAFIDNAAGKPMAIYRQTGKRPILACGNSDGDLEMLQYAAAGPGRNLSILIHHTDQQREYAYDRHSKVGTLDRGLDYARSHDWLVVDMKNDWKKIFAANRRPGKLPGQVPENQEPAPAKSAK